MKEKRYLLPQYMWLPVFITIIVNTLTYNGTRILTEGRIHLDFTTALDRMIPTVPSTVIIYLGCYVFWGLNYIIGCRQDKKEAYTFISADLFAKIICMVIFLLLPTTNARPSMLGDSFYCDAMRFLYRMDAADNLFPSIHCLTSWFCFIAVRKNSTVPKAYKVVSLIITMSICVSTLTTKQHVLIDVIGGIGLAEISYRFVEVSGFANLYRKVLENRFYVQKN